ncbi:MAG: AraC family transcriptional regulator [Rhodothermales bacterium]
MQSNREELAERIARAVPEDGRVSPLEGLTLNRCSSPAGPLHAVAHPCLCIIAQGSKEVHLGERRHRYDPYHYLLVTADLPLVGHVVDASTERPYLSLRLDLNSTVVSSVMVEAGRSAPRGGGDVRALDVSPLSASLLDAAVRLVRLLDAPEEAPVLKPMITREIVYRLLQGEQSDRLGHITVLNGQRHRIARAVRRLRDNFDQTLRVEDLAEELGMSESSFYSHFKAVTDMTPLQFQKQLQLQEARRLMLSHDLDAATAGYRVGYNDASHFNREYKRLFGQPPMRDVERLREAASA